jgi:hypothetical protein
MQLSWACVNQIINRHRTVRMTYVETYSLRHPQRSEPPEKIMRPLIRQANEL